MSTEVTKTKKSKFSYSKLNTYDSCAWKYKLTYEDGHYIFSDTLASELGTLLHHIEETIFKQIKAGEKVNYDLLRKDFIELNIPKTSPYDLDGGIFGLNILKQKYPKEFYDTDENGKSYYTKTLDYMTDGIYRLEQYLNENPDLEPFEAEKFFSFAYHGQVLSGYIDRIFHNKKTDEYIIEDIKTKAKPFKDEDLITPLQLVIYSLGLNKVLDIPLEKISCAYDLPILGLKQKAGTKGFISRGISKLDKIFGGIEDKDFKPNPTPLCHWCQYCPTNPDQTEEGKNLCPYYSLWTRDNKTRDVSHIWKGIEKHSEIIEDEIEKNKKASPEESFDFEF